ncbi:MAG: ABC transporter ATP-binding protein [Planctomycetes bacterium]|nr:ABC transporter ATP-binding protein [Planctomycetota bacterium]
MGPSFVSQTIDLFLELGRQFSHKVDPAAIRALFEESDAEDPLACLPRFAAAVGLMARPVRMRVSEVVWLASRSITVVGWDATAKRWIAIRPHGFLRARAWFSDTPTDDAESISRASLARALHGDGVHGEVEVAVVHLERPVEDMSHGRHAEENPSDQTHVDPVRRLLALMRPEAPEFWTIAIFSLVTGLLYLALPLAINAFISNLSFGSRAIPFLQGLVALAAVVLVCFALAGLLRGLQYVVAEVIRRRIFVRLATDLAQRLPSVDLAGLDREHAPELVNRFLDVVTVQKSASMILLSGINLVLSTTIGLTVLAFYHPFLLAFSIVVLLTLAAIVFLAGRGAVRTSVEESRCKYEVISWMEEIARHPRTFMVGSGVEFARERAEDLVRKYLRGRSSHFSVLMRQIGGLLALEVIAATLLLVLGGWLVLSQQLTLGQLVASEIIVAAIVKSVSSLGKQFEAWYDAAAAVDKLGYLVDLPLQRRGGERALPSDGGFHVEVRQVECSRTDCRRRVVGLSFAAASGERIALVGSRGTETGVILEHLAGLRHPLRGDITIHGIDLRAWDLPCLRSRICLLRAGDVFSGSIADNLALGSSNVDVRKMLSALNSVGLGDLVQSLPGGLDTQLVTGGMPLSDSEGDRLIAARAIVQRPALLLIDGLLDGHDLTREALDAALLQAPIPWTVVVGTSDPRVAALCSRVVECESAEVVAHA